MAPKQQVGYPYSEELKYTSREEIIEKIKEQMEKHA